MELGALARILVENKSQKLPIRDPPFFLEVSPLNRPSKPFRFICEWDGGHLKSARYEPLFPRPADEPPDWDVNGVVPDADFDRVQEVVRFDAQFVQHPVTLEELNETQAWPYHVAYLCADHDRVALRIAHTVGPLSGFGSLVVLERVQGTWRFVEAKFMWEG